MIGSIALSNLCTLHINFHDTKSADKIGIDTINTNTAYRLVASHHLCIKVTDIRNIAISLNEVYVGVLVDSYKTLGFRAPGDVGNIGVSKSVHSVVSDDRQVVLVILIEVIRS